MIPPPSLVSLEPRGEGEVGPRLLAGGRLGGEVASDVGQVVDKLVHAAHVLDARAHEEDAPFVLEHLLKAAAILIVQLP